jgi:hypothetical protein
MEKCKETSPLVKQLTISTLVMMSSGSNDISSSAAASKTKENITDQSLHLS